MPKGLDKKTFDQFTVSLLIRGHVIISLTSKFIFHRVDKTDIIIRMIITKISEKWY